MGKVLDTKFSTQNEYYGKELQNESKYRKIGVKEKIFEDFFKAYVDKEKSEKCKIDENIQNLRLFDTTKSNIHISQGIDYNIPLGKRHMMTQDAIPVENVDKLFMASHDMSKYPSILSNAQVGGYVDRFIPYYKDKEVTYWSMNLDKGNVYHSNSLGENPFSKTSGFTQPLQNTKAVKTFNGNVQGNKNSKNIFLNPLDVEFSEKFKYSQTLNQSESNYDLTAFVKEKIITTCISKGWVGMRKLKLFLRNLNKRNSNNLINKNDFKFHFINFGIVFTEKEVEFIYHKHDFKRNNYIDFNAFLDSFVYLSQERLNLIENFYEQVKNKDNAYVSFKKLEKIVNFDLHPEVNFL